MANAEKDKPYSFRAKLLSRITGRRLVSPTIALGDAIATLANGTQLNVPLGQISVDVSGNVSVTLTAVQNNAVGYIALDLIDASGDEWLDVYFDPVEVVEAGAAAGGASDADIASIIEKLDKIPGKGTGPYMRRHENGKEFTEQILPPGSA